MKTSRRNIAGRRKKEAESNSWNYSDDDIIFDSEDSAIFDKYNEYMKGRLDIEEVMSDPSLKIIESEVRNMITGYENKTTRNEDNERYISDSLKGINEEKNTLKDIYEIKLDTETSDVNEESAGWVKEWQENKKKESDKKPETDERIDFIKRSLVAEINEPATNTHHNDNNGTKRSLVIRYVTISAAAVIGLFVLIRVLLPSPDPEKLYESYYEPFKVVSSATRDIAENRTDGYSTAVEMYKAGDYEAAAAGFSNIMLNDTSFAEPRFLMGVTQMAMGKYDQSIDLLGSIAGRSGEYRKEAFWYLGLAYLKTGEKVKAAKCFEFLSGSPGFYCERSKKLLRRLR
jgi:TolA-binding protein